MMNILAAPGEVYTEIKERPVRHANWVMPALLWAVIGAAVVILLFSQDWAMSEIRKAQRKELEKQVERGKMTQAQVDQAEQAMEKFMPIAVKVGGSVAMLVNAFVTPFFWGFVVWFLGTRFLGGDFEYMKAVEAAGLAMIIYVLTSIVGVLVSFAMGRITYMSPAFFLKEFDLSNKGHLALAAFNPFYLWFTAVMAVALSKLASVSFGKAAVWCFGIWLAIRAVFIAVGLGQMVL